VIGIVPRTLKNLAQQMRRLNKQLPESANRVKKRVATAILTELAKTTPADTGEAVSNWQASIEVPELGQRDPFIPSPRGRMINGVWVHSVDPDVTRKANAGPTIKEGIGVIDKANPGQSIFIANNVPHIQSLNSGSSQQAPAGFVERARVLGRVLVDRLTKLL
jgi:hypothetical protein